jgi:energy-coupling factor transporter transmembrane protein EcfT
MSTFASLILQTVTLLALVAAIASVWHSFRQLIKCIDELAEAGCAQQRRIDSLAERVRVLEAQRLTLADYRSLRGDGTPGEVRTSLYPLGQQPNRL